MQSSLEKNITKNILAYLRSLPGCHVQKRLGGVFQAGEPDIVGCYQGKHLELEVKRPGQKATPRQEAALEKWRRSGAVVGIVHSVVETRTLIEANFSKGGINGESKTGDVRS